VLAQHAPLPDRPDADPGREVLRRAGDDVRAVTGASPHPGSRTTLVTALLAGTTLWWAALGDSALFVVDPSGVRRVDRPSHHFVGHAMARRDLRRAASVGREELGAGAWVVAVSDGFTDFARPSPEKAIAEAFPGEDLSPEAVAGRLVRAAFRGGAGDNVAVAVAAPATPDEGAPPTSAARTPDSAARRSA
jgi:serine/threonine protein phosphatase PrpC